MSPNFGKVVAEPYWRGVHTSADEERQNLSAFLVAEGTMPSSDPELVCEYSAYPLYAEGTYDLRCVHARTYRDPQFKRWTCLLTFQFLDSKDRVCGFLNLGKGDTPAVGRRSKFYRAWAMASEVRPRKQQRMSQQVFVGKVFKVRVRTVTGSCDGGKHGPATQYSVVDELLERLWP